MSPAPDDGYLWEIAYSTRGLGLPTDSNWYTWEGALWDIAYADGTWAAVGNDGVGASVISSSSIDGPWTMTAIGDSEGFQSQATVIAYAEGKWIAGGGIFSGVWSPYYGSAQVAVLWSADSPTGPWTQVFSSYDLGSPFGIGERLTGDVTSISHNGTTWVAATRFGAVLESSDGADWSLAHSFPQGLYDYLGPGYFSPQGLRINFWEGQWFAAHVLPDDFGVTDGNGWVDPRVLVHTASSPGGTWTEQSSIEMERQFFNYYEYDPMVTDICHSPDGYQIAVNDSLYTAATPSGPWSRVVQITDELYGPVSSGVWRVLTSVAYGDGEYAVMAHRYTAEGPVLATTNDVNGPWGKSETEPDPPTSDVGDGTNAGRVRYLNGEWVAVGLNIHLSIDPGNNGVIWLRGDGVGAGWGLLL